MWANSLGHADYAASIGVARMEVHVATDHYASQRVAERAGFAAQDTFTEEDGQEMLGSRQSRDHQEEPRCQLVIMAIWSF